MYLAARPTSCLSPFSRTAVVAPFETSSLAERSSSISPVVADASHRAPPRRPRPRIIPARITTPRSVRRVAVIGATTRAFARAADTVMVCVPLWFGLVSFPHGSVHNARVRPCASFVQRCTVSALAFSRPSRSSSSTRAASGSGVRSGSRRRLEMLWGFIHY